MNQTLHRLERWIKVVQKSVLVLAAIEALVVIIIGIASNNLTNSQYANFWLVTLIILGIIYITITILKIAYNKAFPISIIEELNAQTELTEANQLIIRKDAINDYISTTINLLSECHCEIPIQNEEKSWVEDSDNDIIEGLKSLTSVFNNVLNVLLNTTNFKFTTGIYLKNFRAFDHTNSAQPNRGIFLLRDDYELHRSHIRNIMQKDDLNGVDLEVQSTLLSSLNNDNFIIKEIKTKENRGNDIICISIPDLKDEDANKGVLFIITRHINELPEDLESILKVFCKIISHWLDLYDQEVRNTQLEYITSLIDTEEESEKENSPE